MKSLLPMINKLIERGVVALLIFTPLAFGTVQKWSVSLFEISAYLLLILFLFKGTITGFKYSVSEQDYNSENVATGGFEPLKKGNLKAAVILLALFVELVFLQLLPLPDAVLRLVSPTSLKLYQQFGTSESLHSISINRYATRNDLQLLLAYLSVFFVIIGHYQTRSQLRSLVKTIFCMGIFLVLFALLQKLTWNGRIYWFYPIDENLLNGKINYIWGPFIYRNNFACYLAMVIPFGLAMLIFNSPDRGSSSLSVRSQKIAGFIASPTFAKFTGYFLAVLILTAVLFATLSRGGIAACVVSFAFFIWVTRGRRKLKSRSLFIAMLALLVAAVVIFAAWDRIENRFENSGYIDRATVWKDSIGIMRDYPLFGSGLGTFESTYLRYQSRYNKVLFDHAHNDYVEVVTDTGVAGTILIAVTVLLLFTALYRRWRSRRSTYAQCIGAGGLSASVAMAVHSFTDFNLHIPANALLFTVVVAITYVAVFNLSDNRESYAITPNSTLFTTHVSPLTLKVSRITILLLGCLLLWSPVTGFMADYHYDRVARILDDPKTDYIDFKPLLPETLPDYLNALKAAVTAHELDPQQARYAAGVAEQHTRLGRWVAALAITGAVLPTGVPDRDSSFRQAESYLQMAIALEPTNPDYHLALADVYEVYRHDPVKVDHELQLTAAAFPFNGAVRNAVATHYMLAGRKDEALVQARLLAKNDDSYILNESPQKADILERMPQWYMTMLFKSYLYNAFEIAWRVTRDPQVILSMVPDNQEAANVRDAFLDSKGIELPE
jgi:O-antigen ligase/tetratricopeptide (TPR) repeat protein